MIGDNITLLDYKYQFMGTLHKLDSRLRTRTSAYCLLHKVLECN